MLRFLCVGLFFLLTITCTAQIFSYSENHIKIATSSYKIIGQVKNNIIVWVVRFEKYKRSDILVYDNKLKLIREVSSNILNSDIDAVPNFFSSKDSFYVAYQYQTGDDWKYKLAVFDNDGNLSSIYILDSLKNINAADSLSYNFFQSENKKVLCCAKIIKNNNFNAIKFNCTFVSEGKIYHDNFFLPFDASREKIVDFLIDNDKNVILLKTSDSDSGFIISIVKRKFATDYFLSANKKLDSGYLRSTATYIVDKSNCYNVYGIWENSFRYSFSQREKFKTGVYLWSTNNRLDDISSDTILCNNSAIVSDVSFLANNTLNNKLNSFLGIQTISANITDKGNYFIPQNSTPIPQNPPFNIEVLPRYVSAPSIPGGYMYMPQEPAPTPSNLYARGNGKVPVVQGQAAQLTPDFSVLGISNNHQIEWLNDFKNDPDSMLLNDLADKKIVAGKNGLHVIYSSTLKNNRNIIDHIIISYSGGYQRINTTAWNVKYHYLISQAVATDDGAIIIPCVKDNRLFFAKMTLE